jgi:hypothetical protein
MYVGDESNRKIVVKETFPEEDFWSAVPDGSRQKIQKCVDRDVGTACQIETHKADRKYTAGHLEEERQYTEAELEIWPRGELPEWRAKEWEKKGQIQRMLALAKR